MLIEFFEIEFLINLKLIYLICDINICDYCYLKVLYCFSYLTYLKCLNWRGIIFVN